MQFSCLFLLHIIKPLSVIFLPPFDFPEKLAIKFLQCGIHKHNNNARDFA